MLLRVLIISKNWNVFCFSQEKLSISIKDGYKLSHKYKVKEVIKKKHWYGRIYSIFILGRNIDSNNKKNLNDNFRVRHTKKTIN